MVVIWQVFLIRVKLLNFGNLEFTPVNLMLSIRVDLDVAPLVSKCHLRALKSLGTAAELFKRYLGVGRLPNI